MKKALVSVALAIGLVWAASLESAERPDQISSMTGKSSNKLNPATFFKYRTEAEAEIVAKNELASWLETMRTAGDTERLRMFEGAHLAPPVKFINARGKVVEFKYDVKKDGKYVGVVNVEAEFLPLEVPGPTPHSSQRAFSPHDSSLGTAASWRVDKCLEKIRKRIGKDAKLEGPFFYQMGYYGFQTVAFKDVNTRKLHFCVLADTALLPEKTTLRSLQEECDSVTQWRYEKALKNWDKPLK